MSDEIPEYEAPTFKPVSIDMEFHDVDPEVLGILTGGVIGTPPTPTFSIDVTVPVKRTFWQWLRRKPKQHRRIFVPNATMAKGGCGDPNCGDCRQEWGGHRG